jgi:hypothetical protein
MNALDRDLGGPASVHYGDGEFVVMKPGRYVVCAVSGRRVPLETLRYWNAELQEPYAGPEEALQRWKQLQGRP